MSLETLARDDVSYDVARRATMWNRLVPDRFPARVVRARTVDDVVEAVRTAVGEGRAVTVRSGGHSWAGNHVRDDVVLLDLSALDEVRIDVATMRAVVGPGVRGDRLLDRLLRHGLFFPVGHCRGVGVGGYLLQGGFGWNGRALGLACESVVAIDYVDAEGVLRHASETDDRELLWAARGSGPGFFGVVVRYHLRLHPRPGFIGVAGASYGDDRLDDVFAWADAVGPDVPVEVELDLLMSRETLGVRGVGVQVGAFVFADDWRAARRATRFLGSRPRGARVVLPTVPVPIGRLFSAAMSHYPDDHRWAVDNLWTHAGWDDLRTGVLGVASSLPGSPSHLLWMNWGAVASTDMAFSMEDRTYLAVYAGWTHPALDDAHVAWATESVRALEPFATGIQLADENLGRRPARFVTDENLDRLDALRARRDPAGRFVEWMGRP